MKTLGIVAVGAMFAATAAAAEPILKPRKYHGPIPQSSISLRVGFLGGAENPEMIDFLDGDRAQRRDAFSEDFGNGVLLELAYVKKVHPQFGLRAAVSATALRSEGSGIFIPESGSSGSGGLRPAQDYKRDFDTDLIIGEASALYYFSDASVNEFQSYAGGGFSFGFPHQKFKEKRNNVDNGKYEKLVDIDKWSFEAGVHGILGALYYITNTFAASMEGRYQLMESKFPLETTNEDDELEEVKFVVDYSGFFISVGVTWGF